MSVSCPLCSNIQTGLFYSLTGKLGKKEFYLCRTCNLIFVPAEFHPNPKEEKSRYDLHRNDPSEADYVNHLQRYVNIIKPFLEAGMKVLDFGCGPYPVLAEILKKNGLEIEVFDPFYFNNSGVLEMDFDLITCTETVEHFREPGTEFRNLDRVLKKDGLLCIMTGIVTDRENFPNWHYIHDITHIAFYSRITFEWLAEFFKWWILYMENDVIIFSKN